MGIMELAFEAYEMRQMALPLLTIVFAILAILFFIYYGAGAAFYITAIIGLVFGFLGARAASNQHVDAAPAETRAASSSVHSPSKRPRPGKNK